MLHNIIFQFDNKSSFHFCLDRCDLNRPLAVLFVKLNSSNNLNSDNHLIVNQSIVSKKLYDFLWIVFF